MKDVRIRAINNKSRGWKQGGRDSYDGFQR